jgi:hypothetical protein
VIILLALGCITCKEDRNANFIGRLGNLEKKFPQDYYTQDSLHVIDIKDGKSDTFLLLGKEIERYVSVDNHTSGDDGYTTTHEVLQKNFQSENSDFFLILRASTMGDSPFPEPNGGFNLRGTNLYLSFTFGDVEDTTNDQFIPDNYSEEDTIVYNIKTGIRAIKLHSSSQPRTLLFY